MEYKLNKIKVFNILSITEFLKGIYLVKRLNQIIEFYVKNDIILNLSKK